jgi:hypothetical protein
VIQDISEPPCSVLGRQGTSLVVALELPVNTETRNTHLHEDKEHGGQERERMGSCLPFQTADGVWVASRASLKTQTRTIGMLCTIVSYIDQRFGRCKVQIR